ncbi:hypothetical protein [Desulfobacca acetoxidans]|uniref:Addiction module protein n=1 Tax=Desulfobacca acetoxidans (strain ATCC 700848 / DSM 11109 / ASRB2) TaxID=880072 RepID=F2NHL4_DESAR|nr:hypothetical protein [Desulfobacca acetoxidans]AEB09201.1 hypothetical protein Desac_1344 [Desulfobacca acetoxidans DSM 11109]HAY21512.1 hypothetical protein [Desulfobacterales bacterium]
MKSVLNIELLNKFQAVAQGPDGDLLINLLDILYARIADQENDDQYLSPDDLEAIRRGQEDMQGGRFLSLEDYRSGKRL